MAREASDHLKTFPELVTIFIEFYDRTEPLVNGANVAFWTGVRMADIVKETGNQVRSCLFILHNLEAGCLRKFFERTAHDSKEIDRFRGMIKYFYFLTSGLLQEL